ncbi:PD40 domain-containing protein [candidate division WOR-3 bacterium]|nr:PD40 domain-containing protein [candidate division WOR-3 bacterium]
MKTRKSSIIVMLILVILVVISQCSDRHAVNFPIEYPPASASSPVWSPDGSQIMFGFAPSLKLDDTTYEIIEDSCGLWIIEPNGSSLSMFMHFFPHGPKPADWHPSANSILAKFGGHLVRVDFIDTTIQTIDFDEGVTSARFNAAGNKISAAVNVPGFSEIWVMDTNGTNAHRAIENIAWLHDWSPDDRRFAFQDSDGGLSIVDSNDTNRRQIVTGAGMYSSPSFSPDGEKIVFDMRMDTYPTDYDIYIVNTDGTNLRKLATGRYPVWSPDGSRIAYVKYSYEGEYDEGNGQLWIMDSNGTNKMQLTFVRVEEQ